MTRVRYNGRIVKRCKDIQSRRSSYPQHPTNSSIPIELQCDIILLVTVHNASSEQHIPIVLLERCAKKNKRDPRFPRNDSGILATMCSKNQMLAIQEHQPVYPNTRPNRLSKTFPIIRISTAMPC